MPKIISSEPKKNIGKRVLIGLIIVVVLAGLGAGGWYWWQQTHKPAAPAQPTAASTTGNVDTAKVTQIQQKASEAANTSTGGSVDQATKIYDQAIQSTPASDTATTASLYYGKATLLYNNKQSSDALVAAQKAVSLDPSAGNYGLLGTIYANLGQKDNAIAAFKSALTAISAVSSDGGAGKGAMTLYYQQQIQQLGGTL